MVLLSIRGAAALLPENVMQFCEKIAIFLPNVGWGRGRQEVASTHPSSPHLCAYDCMSGYVNTVAFRVVTRSPNVAFRANQQMVERRVKG